MNTPREGLPELPAHSFEVVRGGITECTVTRYYTAAQMHKFREEGIAAALAGQPAQVGGEVVKVCDGCPHLATKYWRDHLDNDETDSGTEATCTAEKRCIDVYWHKGNASPDWCPLRAALPQPQPERGEVKRTVCDECNGHGCVVLEHELCDKCEGFGELAPPPPSDAAQGESLKLADELDEWARQYQLDGGYSNPTLIAAAATIRRLSAARPVRVDVCQSVNLSNAALWAEQVSERIDIPGGVRHAARGVARNLRELHTALAAHKGEGNG